jgi:hypothetical protein
MPLLLVDFLLDMRFDYEDRSNKFLRNVGGLIRLD